MEEFIKYLNTTINLINRLIEEELPLQSPQDSFYEYQESLKIKTLTQRILTDFKEELNISQEEDIKEFYKLQNKKEEDITKIIDCIKQCLVLKNYSKTSTRGLESYIEQANNYINEFQNTIKEAQKNAQATIEKFQIELKKQKDQYQKYLNIFTQNNIPTETNLTDFDQLSAFLTKINISNTYKLEVLSIYITKIFQTRNKEAETEQILTSHAVDNNRETIFIPTKFISSPTSKEEQPSPFQEQLSQNEIKTKKYKEELNKIKINELSQEEQTEIESLKETLKKIIASNGAIEEIIKNYQECKKQYLGNEENFNLKEWNWKIYGNNFQENYPIEYLETILHLKELIELYSQYRKNYTEYLKLKEQIKAQTIITDDNYNQYIDYLKELKEMHQLIIESINEEKSLYKTFKEKYEGRIKTPASPKSEITISNDNLLIFLRSNTDPKLTLYEEDSTNHQPITQITSFKLLGQLSRVTTNTGKNTSQYGRFIDDIQETKHNGKTGETVIVNGRKLQRVSQARKMSRIPIILIKTDDAIKNKLGLKNNHGVYIILGNYEINFNNEAESYSDMIKRVTNDYKSEIDCIMKDFSNPNTTYETLQSYISQSQEDIKRITTQELITETRSQRGGR